MSLQTALARKSIAFATNIAQAHALGAMNSMVLIERHGAYDETAREYDNSAMTVIYDNPDPALAGSGWTAGIAPTQGPVTMELGDEVEYYDSITLRLPQGQTNGARISDLVTVVTTPDNDLVGRLFKIVSAIAGGRILSSNEFVCQGIAPSQEWGT